jgi:hypothetical protein
MRKNEPKLWMAGIIMANLVLNPLVQGLDAGSANMDVNDIDNIVLRGTQMPASAFKPRFVILYSEKDPKLELRPMSNIKYNLSSWVSADPSTAARGIMSQRDNNSVGDGFDPAILKGDGKGRTFDLFQAAPAYWVSATRHTASTREHVFEFEKHSLFALEARLESLPGSGYPRLTFSFTPAKAGYYSVGYVGAPGVDLSAVEDLWQPLIWQEKRFPEESYLTLAFRCSVPSAFVSANGVTVGVVADPSEFPFDPLPLLANSRFGVALRDPEGQARPMLFAPAFGGTESKMKPGQTYRFSMRLFSTAGNTMDAQERVARELYGFIDYRNNALGSLNRTIDNLHDYIMSPYSLFQEELKGCNYSTDAPGAVKNVSSIDPLDLAIVMDDPQMFVHRAYPYIEYMLSRGKFLFTTDEQQKIQSPSYRLNGPTAPISELASLYSIFHQATPLFNSLAKSEFESSRVRNLSVLEAGDTWWNALSLYRVNQDKRYLDMAIDGADKYIAQRVNTAQTDFNDPASGEGFFWTGFAPRYIDLLLLYEASGEKRFLDAARTGARRYAQYVWMSPAIPKTEILVNKGGKAPEYWYLKKKGHKQVLLPEERVPAWRLSEIGLTPESSGTSSGHRAIFMANHAPWMLKIGYLTNDSFLMDIARSAVIGRYRNYPGYHINTARTTAYEKKDFPLCGHKDQSVGSFHYNHPLPMLAMLVDYLVTDAHVRSEGKIDLPYNYSEGYAYMQNKAYGAMQGTFYGRDDARFWMPNALLQVPDQINYLTARGQNDLYVALMNESEQDIMAEIHFNKDVLPTAYNKDYVVKLFAGNRSARSTLRGGSIRVPVRARGLTAMVIESLKVRPAFQDKITDLDHTDAWDVDMIDLKDPDGRSMILNLGSENRYAYVYLEYSKHDYEKVELLYNAGSGENQVTKSEFPWEFTVPLDADAESLTFSMIGYKQDGKRVELSQPQTLSKRGPASMTDTGSAKHLFILSGQSNMAGLDPSQSFIPAVEKAFGKENIIVVKDAMGGAPIRRWYKAWKPAKGWLPPKGESMPMPDADLYARLMTKVKAAIEGRRIKSVTFIWMQGETDAREGHGKVYATSFKGLLKQLQNDLDRDDINVVIGRLSDHGIGMKKFPHWMMIRETQVELAEADPRGAWVDTDDLNDGVNRKGKSISNDLHYSVDGYQTLGERFAEKAIALAGKARKSKYKEEQQ